MKKLLYAFLAISFLFVGCKDDDEDNGIPGNNLNTGGSAKDFLTAATFNKVVLEVQYPAGFAPPAGALDNLEAFILKYCNKPNGVEVVASQIPDAAKAGYTLDEIRGIEDQYRTKFNSESTLAMYIFMAGGDYVENDDTVKTLGIAYKNTSIVCFGKTIKDNSGGLGRPSEERVTSAIYEHELGHLLGLVNIGSPMVDNHEDTDNGHAGHCDVESCLMYFSLNSVTAMGNLMGSLPDLDAQCKADLRANGGK